MRIARLFFFVSFLFSLAATSQALADDRVIAIGDTPVFPASYTIYVGDRVRWLNTTLLEHTVTFGYPCDHPGAQLGVSWDFTVPPLESSPYYEFIQPGTWTYYCRFHCALVGQGLYSEAGELTVVAPLATQQKTWGAVKALFAAQTTAH